MRWSSMVGGRGGTARPHPSWRPDIQGLRAIAVLSVLFFHLEFWPFRGGFVGVDIFFVISGYLISQGVFIDIAEGRFSLGRFYERRARRILPVFLLTAIGTTVAAYAILVPSEFVGYAQTLIASSLFVANMLFYSTHNYFGPSPDTVPLLHLWSLGVEEQFYLLFPLFALGMAALATSRQKVLVVVVGLFSFGLSAVLTHRHPTAAFYLLPFRAFEFLIGSYLALPSTAPPRDAVSARLAAGSGLAALAYSIFVLQTDTDFPGTVAAIPCFGTGLLIWAGTHRSTAVTRLLSTRPLTYFGNISYSLYMVHWPVIVMTGQLRPQIHPVWRAAGIFALSVLLSTVLFYAVEQPLRRARPGRGPVFLAGSVASLLATALVGFGIVRAAGFPGRIEARVAYYLSYLDYEPTGMTRSRKCFLEVEQDASQYDVGLCLPDVEPGQQFVVLWGDSIAAHLYAGLSEALSPHGIVLGQATASACPAALEYDAPQRPFCRPFDSRALALILQRKPAAVLITGSWGDPASLSHTREVVERLKSAAIPVILIGPPPYYQEPVPKILARRLEDGLRGRPTQSDLQSFVPFRENVASTLAGKLRVPFVSILHSYCPADDCPLVTASGVPIEFDALHFTLAGSHFVAGRISGEIVQGIDAGSATTRPPSGQVRVP